MQKILILINVNLIQLINAFIWNIIFFRPQTFDQKCVFWFYELWVIVCIYEDIKHRVHIMEI